MVILALLLPIVVAYFLFFYSPPPVSVRISSVDHEVLFSGVSPSGPSGAFFSSTTYSSAFVVSPGGVFNDTISFQSIPSFQNFEVINISVSSPTSSSFSIEAMNATLPLAISPNHTSSTIMLTIRVPDSEFNGQVTIEATIGP